MSINVSILDDNKIFLEEVNDFINGTFNDVSLDVCSKVSDVYVGKKVTNIDLFIADYDLGDNYDGVTVGKDLRERGYTGHIVLISGGDKNELEKICQEKNLLGTTIIEKASGKFYECIEELIEQRKADRVSTIAERIQNFLKVVEDSLFEREELSRLLVFTLFAQTNLFMYGPPGTAKSQVVNYIKSAFKELRFFRYLMTDYTVDEDIFGELVIDGGTGKKKRLIEGKLPNAQLVFLDEIFKANASILNALLTILNEKKFDDVDMTRDVPLISAISASNEFPRTTYLRALFERFPIRVPVLNVKKSESILRIFNDEFGTNGGELPEFLLYDIDFVDKNWQAKTKNSPEVQEYFVEIKNKLEAKMNAVEGYGERLYEYSGRTMGFTGKFVRISAYMNGRSFTDESDLFLMKYIAWNDMDQRTMVWRLLDNIFYGERKNTIEEIHIFLKDVDSTIERYRREFNPIFIGSRVIEKNKFDAFKISITEIVDSLVFLKKTLDSYKELMLKHAKINNLLAKNIFLSEKDVMGWDLNDEKYFHEIKNGLGMVEEVVEQGLISEMFKIKEDEILKAYYQLRDFYENTEDFYDYQIKISRIQDGFKK